MAQDWLLDPVTDDQPCGPDLERDDDPDFLDYYYEAESRLPERYFVPGNPNMPGGAEDRLFDPRTVALKQETEAITALLHRSRDLRLLTLLARFQILAAKPDAFADTIEDVARLLSERPTDVHPQMARSVSERRGALDALAEQASVVMPLIHLQVPANAQVSLRHYMVATGAVPPRIGETDAPPDLAAILGVIRAPAHLAAVTRLHADLTRAAHGLVRIAALCKAGGTTAFNPDFTAVLETITDVQRMIREALPDLALWSDQPDLLPTPDPAPAEAVADDDAPAKETAPETRPAPLAVLPIGDVRIPDHAAASAAISAAERYLVAHEPSSLSLLLVTQARLLVGKSIVEALELLMPEQAGRAELTLGNGPGFTLDMARLKMLSQAAAPENQRKNADSIDLAATKPPAINDRNELAGYLRAVEDFYLRHEPASPVPVLLGGARQMLAKTFHTILAEILPVAATQGQA